jgi:hypothetical protein
MHTVKDFFISYNQADRAWAEWIAWQIKEQGREVVIQAWHFGPGSNFPLQMHKAIRECQKILVVLSPDFLASEYTKPEWAAYFAQDPTGEKRKIMPVRVRDCTPDGLLGQIVHIDLLGVAPEGEARRVLLEGLFGGGVPTTPPSFPGPRGLLATKTRKPKPPFPGAAHPARPAPVAFHPPQGRNPNFSGREDYLKDLAKALASGEPAALTQALAGLGGVGKTQLALEEAGADMEESGRALPPATRPWATNPKPPSRAPARRRARPGAGPRAWTARPACAISARLGPAWCPVAAPPATMATSGGGCAKI